MNDVGPFDPDELVRWAENYGYPEEWAKKAQAAHARSEQVLERTQEAIAWCERMARANAGTTATAYRLCADRLRSPEDFKAKR